jgi:hypothetical protein
MLVVADQVVAHLVGDYILQSDWMALEKTKRSIPAIVHAVAYSLPFLFFRPSLLAWLVIVLTHFIIDRWRLARFVVYAKNFIAPWGYRPSRAPWSEYAATGYHESRPRWMAVWLMIIADNTMHLLCNGIALKCL